MPALHSLKWKSQLEQIDNALLNAQAGLYGYYFPLLRADPALAAAVEGMLYTLEDLREQTHQIYQAAWESDCDQFDTIGQIDALVKEARHDVLGRSSTCQAYSDLWETSLARSSLLLERRARASRKPSASRVHSRPPSRSKT